MAEDSQPPGSPGFSLQDVGTDKIYQCPSTPRSLEACELQGLDPHELLVKELEEFKTEPGVTAKIAKMRYNFYEKDRARKVHDVMVEYKSILAHGARSQGMSKEEKLAMAAEAMGKIKVREDALQEKKRIKQAKEVSQLMFVQKQTLDVQEQMKEQEAKAAEREAAQEQERQRKAEEREQNAKVQAQRRKEKADGVAQEMADTLAKAKLKEEALRQRELEEAELREQTKRMKDEELRQRQVQIEEERAAKAQEEEDKIRARLQKMAEQEAERKDRIAREQEERLEANEQKRRETEARLKAAAESAAAQERAVAEAAEAKKALAEQRLEERRAKEEEDNRVRRKMEAAKAEQQMAVRRKMEADYAAKIDNLIQAQELAAARQRDLEKKMEIERMEKDEARQLLLSQKRDYILRKARIQEYHKQKAKVRLKDDSEAALEVKMQKGELMKAMQIRRKDEKTKMDNIREQMDHMRVTKKYGYPAGFEPPSDPIPEPPSSARSHASARSQPASLAPTARSKDPRRRRTAGAAGGVKAETANLYTHWTKQITGKKKNDQKKKRRLKKSAIPEPQRTPALISQYTPPNPQGVNPLGGQSPAPEE